MITGYHIALILFSAYATYLIRNVDGIHSDFSYLALVLATLCILALTEVLFNQHSTSPLSKRVIHEFFTWLILMGVVGVKCFTRVYALWNDSRASSRLKQLSVLSIPILQRLLSGEEKNTRTALQPSEQFREEAPKAMGSALGQLKSNYYYGKTTCVVYRVDRVGAKWIPALCVSCFERRNAFILLIPCDPGNRAVGICLESKECLKVIQRGSLPFRLSAKNRLQNKALLIDFHSKERGMALLQNLFYLH
ncbi:hypothetical protein BDR26DRAFT_864506 [Obelidium mucronatum]|nr:hypothetical protein BDR26DRAFT_864506 [Obelidium mucronatum]